MNRFYQSIVNTGSNTEDPVDSNIENYFIIAGQSNAAGREITSFLNDEYGYLLGEIKLNGNRANVKNRAINDSSFETLETGRNTSDLLDNSKFGIQPFFSYKMLEGYNKNFNFIQCAFGGTPISNYTYETDNFTWITDTARDLRMSLSASEKKLKIPFMLWIQGESDAVNLFNYKSTLINMISDYRLRLGQPDMAFVIGQMIDCQTAVPNLDQLQQIQLDVSQEVENCYLIPKDIGVNDCVDPLHWSGEYYYEASEYLFNLTKNFILKN